MSAGQVWETAGGIASVLAVVGVLSRISWQLANFATELKRWRHQTDGRLSALEDGNYVPRHRGAR